MKAKTLPESGPEQISALLIYGVIAFGLLNILGWVCRIDWLKNQFPGQSPVAMSTSICLILSAASIYFLSRKKLLLCRSFAAGSASICLGILAFYLFGGFDIDKFLLAEKHLALISAGRMSPTILISILLINLSGVTNSKSLIALRALLLAFASILCITAFTAHFFELPSLMRISTVIQMSSPAAISGFCLVLSLLLLAPELGLIRLLTSPGTGGKFLRLVLIPTLVLPFLLGRVSLFVISAQAYSENLGIAILVLISFCFLLPLIVGVAIWLDESDRKRSLLEQENLSNKRLIVDASAQAFIMVNSTGSVIEWNPAAEKLLGWKKSEALGRSFEFIIAPEHRQTKLQEFAEYLQDPDQTRLNQSVELEMQRKDGSCFTAEGTPFQMDVGQNTLLCSFWHDISERKRAERRINEFISTVSHELRTPLTSIKGALRLIEGGLAGEIAREGMMLISIASSETERLIRLVNDILDLKKIEAGKLELKCKNVEIRSLSESAIEALSGMASEFGINLILSSNLRGTISCDQDRIIQVLANLLSNAIKFSEPGSEVRLECSSPEANTVRFSVVDNGCGIADNQAEKLFERFQQLDSSDTRQQGGTGLGLAISKAIVEEHKGKIGFTSSLGKGSTFWFELPALSLNITAQTQKPGLLQNSGSKKFPE